MNNFRKLALEKLSNFNQIVTSSSFSSKNFIKNSGTLTEFVQKHLGLKNNSNFRQKFSTLPPGPEREKFVLEEIIKRNPINQLVPVTVPGPNNTTITYKVMPDYLTIDGVRVPMAGQTAQKVADHFNMHLPTAKMSKQIYDAADTKILPTPLSSSGVEIDGKFYSAEEVVRSKISDSGAALAYSDKIEQELANAAPGTLVGGHMKDLIAPENDPSKLGLYGWYDAKGNPIQSSAQTPHDTSIHTEYGAGVRLVGDEVTVSSSDGRKINTSMKDLLNHPEFSKAISRVQGYKRY